MCAYDIFPVVGVCGLDPLQTCRTRLCTHTSPVYCARHRILTVGFVWVCGGVAHRVIPAACVCASRLTELDSFHCECVCVAAKLLVHQWTSDTSPHTNMKASELRMGTLQPVPSLQQGAAHIKGHIAHSVVSANTIPVTNVHALHVRNRKEVCCRPSSFVWHTVCAYAYMQRRLSTRRRSLHCNLPLTTLSKCSVIP